jgi:predicted AlkP superfamily pyrophosphatase or phosphodiesterase
MEEGKQMKHNFLSILLCALLCSSVVSYECCTKKPRLIVVIVIDQFAYSYLRTLACHLQYGFKFLLRNGIVYENAYFPHAMPSTAPGHTGLNTGTTASYHGIISNGWFDSNNNDISADDDSTPVINPRGGFYDYGKGPSNIMVDGITDQFVLTSQPDTDYLSYSISLKSRSAICTANKLGHAIWLDSNTGQFTSSKAYFDTLPTWLMRFNQQRSLRRLNGVRWPLFYPKNSSAYNFKFIDNYQFSSQPSMIGKTTPIDWSGTDPLKLFARTPAANQLLFDCAAQCIKSTIDRNSCNNLLVWLCLSPLDKVGHDFGPYSREIIDMIYHLDYQLQHFMDDLSYYLPRADVLFVLTADHGVSPIPELLNEQGYKPAQRINTTTMIEEVNQLLEQKFDLEKLISSCHASQFYFDRAQLHALKSKQQKEIVSFAQKAISNYSGVKRVWTYQELNKAWPQPDQIESFYKNQLYPGRSGDLIIQPEPYCIIDDFDKGTGHRTPYESDTHVPLILYQKHSIERRVIHEKVWTLQLANSLAHILGIQKPSASLYPILPGLIDYDRITSEALQTVVL